MKLTDFIPTVWKGRKPKGLSNTFFQMLYNNLAIGQPILMADNKHNYVSEGYLKNPDIYSIISKILKECSKVPPRLDDWSTGEAVEIPEHELLDFLKNPNPYQGYGDFVQQEIGFKLITGDTFTYYLYPSGGANKGIPREMFVLPAHFVEIAFNTVFDPIRGYKLIVSQDFFKELPAENVIHRKYFNPGGFDSSGSHLYGVSPLQAARQLTQSSNDTYRAKMSLAQKVGAIGILSQDADDPDAMMSEDEAQAVANNFRTNNTGPSNYGKIIIAASKVSWQQIGLSPVDLQFAESLQNDFLTFCDIYDMPSGVFSRGKQSTYNNKSEDRKLMFVNCIVPEMDNLYEAWNKHLTPRFQKEGQRLRLRPDYRKVPELRADLKVLADTTSKLWQLTPNQVLDLIDQPPSDDPNMDKVYIPTNLVPIEMAGKTVKPQAK